MRVSGRVLLSVLLLVTSVTSILQAQPASAAPITARKATLGSSAISVQTTYVFNFTVPTTGTAIRSAAFVACTSPDPAADCSTLTPTGFSVTAPSASTLTSQPTNLGAASGWTINTSTAGALRIVNAANATNPSGAQTVSFSNVRNPSTENQTFYLHIKTYSDAAWTTPIDSGVVAVSTSKVIEVRGTMPESLIFCTAATIGVNGGGNPDCTTATNGVVNFTTLFSAIAPAVATSQIAASTNATSGYVITVTGTTLTAPGPVTIPAIGATPAASAPGSGQFGLNLVDNATPNVGAAISAASGSAVLQARPLTGFDTADQFTFNAGAINTIADSGFDGTPGPTNGQIYTVAYIANVAGSQAAGDYEAELTYICTPTF